MGTTSGIWHPSQYNGKKVATVRVGQLVSEGIIRRSQEKQVERDWIDFFSSKETRILDLTIWSRVKQEIVDALAGQTQLEKLTIKWGPYADLSAIGKLCNLVELELGGAKNVADLSPLFALQRLESLIVDQAHSLADISQLGRMTTLRRLGYGNGYPGSDKNVAIHDFEWIRPLVNLESLSLAGTTFDGVDLRVLASMPKLKFLNMPLRRNNRKQVFELAESSPVFAAWAKDYLGYEKMRAKLETKRSRWWNLFSR